MFLTNEKLARPRGVESCNLLCCALTENQKVFFRVVLKVLKVRTENRKVLCYCRASPRQTHWRLEGGAALQQAQRDVSNGVGHSQVLCCVAQRPSLSFFELSAFIKMCMCHSALGIVWLPLTLSRVGWLGCEKKVNSRRQRVWCAESARPHQTRRHSKKFNFKYAYFITYYYSKGTGFM